MAVIVIAGQQHHAEILESETRKVNWSGGNRRFFPGPQQFAGRQISGFCRWFDKVSGGYNEIDLGSDLVVDILHDAAHSVSWRKAAPEGFLRFTKVVVRNMNE